nr:FkbM family methyltransferase [Nocardioides soli]
MGLESTVRAWAHQVGLQKFPPVVTAYRAFVSFRYRNKWDSDVVFRGHRFQIGRDLSLYPAVANGGFEEQELDALLPRVPVDAQVWDVGGNIGIYAVLLADAARDGHVVAFEPVPDSHARLVGNLERNGVRNVTVNQVALSDKDGVAVMAVHADAHGCDQIGGPVEPGVAALEVETTSADAFQARQGLPDPDVVKVDIEGHEPEFLDGAWGMLSRRKPLLMLEVNPAAWSADRYDRWQATLDKLFGLYGSGQWYQAASHAVVSHVDVHGLEPHAYTLILPPAAVGVGA